MVVIHLVLYLRAWLRWPSSACATDMTLFFSPCSILRRKLFFPEMEHRQMGEVCAHAGLVVGIAGIPIARWRRNGRVLPLPSAFLAHLPTLFARCTAVVSSVVQDHLLPSHLHPHPHAHANCKGRPTLHGHAKPSHPSSSSSTSTPPRGLPAKILAGRTGAAVPPQSAEADVDATCRVRIGGSSSTGTP